MNEQIESLGPGHEAAVGLLALSPLNFFQVVGFIQDGLPVAAIEQIFRESFEFEERKATDKTEAFISDIRVAAEWIREQLEQVRAMQIRIEGEENEWDNLDPGGGK